MRPRDSIYEDMVEGHAEGRVDEQLRAQLESIRAQRCRLLDALLFYDTNHEELPFDLLADARRLQLEEDQVARQLGVQGPMIHPLFADCLGEA